MITNPFGLLSQGDQIRLLWICLSLLIASGLGSWLALRRLMPGIVAYEIAGTPTRSRVVIDAWEKSPLGRGALLRVAFSLDLDYLLIIGYVGSIGLSCNVLSSSFRVSGMVVLGDLLAWGQIAAGLLDALENAALIRMLFCSVSDPWPAVARTCSLAKFALICPGMGYTAIGLFVTLLGQRGSFARTGSDLPVADSVLTKLVVRFKLLETKLTRDREMIVRTSIRSLETSPGSQEGTRQLYLRSQINISKPLSSLACISRGTRVTEHSSEVKMRL
jgi:hypothetical protein